MGKIDATWYEENYTPWIDKINSIEDLLDFHDSLNGRYKRRFYYWFKDIDLEADILELGFNNGKTLRWLKDKYGNKIELSTIDFNPKLEKIIPYIERWIEEWEIVDFKDLDSKPFSHIMCLDFIEHLYYKDYLKSIEKIKALLDDGGRCYVFGGYAKQVEHVNILSSEQIAEDFMAQGFKSIRKISHPETGDIMQIFEK